MTSNDSERPQLTPKGRSKNVKGGFVHKDNIEFNEQYLDKILDNNNS